jgi:branched-chain amino acid transport system ATP-binding protein
VSLLALERLEVAYGGIRAVKGIDLEVAAGEMVCLIGANGAGKSTTLRAITGLVHAAAGRIRYDGADIGGLRVHEIARRGLAMVPEGRGVFPQLTIEENLGMGAYARRDHAAVKVDREHAYHLFPRLHERRAQTAGTLSGGEQQMLAIARALMSRPRLLLLDEPSMGLAPLFVEEIFAIIASLKLDGTTILLVEQNASAALDVADHAYVLETGRIVLSGPAAQVAADPAVAAAYLGG